MEFAVDAAGPTQVVMSGGSKTSDRDFLSTVKGAIDAGAVGLAVGRNVWQRENPPSSSTPSRPSSTRRRASRRRSPASE